MKKSIVLFLLLTFSSVFAAPPTITASDLVLSVSVPEQKMLVTQGGKILKTYTISTSKFGIGTEYGSNKTPPGWHKVHSRYGKNAALGQVFRSRVAKKGEILEGDKLLEGDEDLVLTRILWLEGIEKGKNTGGKIKSLERCFYIHGTNQESKLGTPASHGCIRMYNKDVIELFSLAADHKTVYVNVLRKGFL